MPTGYSNKTGQNPFKGKKRKPFTLEHRKKISLSHKGKIPWNKGIKGVIKFSEKTKEKMKNSAHKGKNHHSWKGGEVGYDALHRWINRMKGKPRKCRICRTTKGRIQWANFDHKYKRNLDDWIALCPKCHYSYDELILNVKHGYNRK